MHRHSETHALETGGECDGDRFDLASDAAVGVNPRVSFRISFSMALGNVVGSIWFAFQGSCCVAQADLELRILLTQPLPPQCWVVCAIMIS